MLQLKLQLELGKKQDKKSIMMIIIYKNLVNIYFETFIFSFDKVEKRASNRVLKEAYLQKILLEIEDLIAILLF